jgi:hypothetical protein
MGAGAEAGEPLCRELLEALFSACCALLSELSKKTDRAIAMLILRMTALLLGSEIMETGRSGPMLFGIVVAAHGLVNRLLATIRS